MFLSASLKNRLIRESAFFQKGETKSFCHILIIHGPAKLFRKKINPGGTYFSQNNQKVLDAFFSGLFKNGKETKYIVIITNLILIYYINLFLGEKHIL